MSKIRYQATFQNGTVITRSSERDYSHAWVVTADCDGPHCAEGEVLAKGFSSSEALARSAALAYAARWVSQPVTAAITQAITA